MFPLVLIVACSRTGGAAQPAQQQPGPPPPAPEISTLVVPIRSELGAVSAEIEARVEKHFAGKARERGIDIEYVVDRAPIQLQMVGAGLHSSTTVKYAMQACRGRFPCISCGFGEARRIADIKLHTKLNWDPQWRLRSITTLLPVNYARPCEVTWLDIDITRRFVAPVVERQLQAAARLIDRNVPALANVRPQAEQIWNALQQPSELAERTWLVLEPIDAALSPISGNGSMITTTLVLRAQTRVVVGEKPAVSVRPLPALKSVAAGAQPAVMRVPFDLQIPYDEASRIASRDYAGQTVKVNGKPLTIETIRVAPSTNGRLLVEATIDYRGGALRNYRGVVYLEGTPRFDAATSSVVVPDLDYTLDPQRRGVLGRIAERAAHDSIRQRLRESARFALGPRLAEVRTEMNRALTRQLAPGVQLRGRADAIEPVSVTPSAYVIVTRVVATGTAEVTVSMR